MGGQPLNLKRLKMRIASVHSIALCGFVLCVIGPLLPWLQVRTLFSARGFEHPVGAFVLGIAVLGLAGALYGALRGRERLGWAYTGAGVLLFVLGILVLLTAQNRLVGMGFGREENLLHNPSFEEGDVHWGDTGELQFHEGGGGADTTSTRWWKIVRDERNRTDSQLDLDGEIRWLEVRSGQVYEIGGDLVSDGRATARFQGEIRDEDNNRVTWVASVSLRTTSDRWTERKHRFTVPDDGRFLRVFVQAVDEDGWAGFDNLFLRRIDVLSAGPGVFLTLLGGMIASLSVLALQKVNAVVFQERESALRTWEVFLGLALGMGFCGVIGAVVFALFP